LTTATHQTLPAYDPSDSSLPSCVPQGNRSYFDSSEILSLLDFLQHHFLQSVLKNKGDFSFFDFNAFLGLLD
jgi:hypothetical protein